MSPRARQVAVRLLVVLSSILAVLALLTGYVRRTVVDSDQFANRATVALHDDSVRSLIAEKITDEVVLKNESDLIAARPIIQSATSVIIGSRAFTEGDGEGRAGEGRPWECGRRSCAPRRPHPLPRDPLGGSNGGGRGRRAAAVTRSPPHDGWARGRSCGGRRPADRDGPTSDWPTLGEMIERDQRIVFLAENDAGSAPWYRLAYEGITQETPYAFSKVSQLTTPDQLPASCKPNPVRTRHRSSS